MGTFIAFPKLPSVRLQGFFPKQNAERKETRKEWETNLVGGGVGLLNPYNVWGQIDASVDTSKWNSLSQDLSALTLVIRRQEEKDTRSVNNWVQSWLSVCSEVQMIGILWSSWCHYHPITSCFIFLKFRMVCLSDATDLPMWTMLSWKNRPLKSVSVCQVARTVLRGHKW